MKRKVVTVEELAQAAQEMREAGKKLVVTNGCFDLLHVGHIRYLQAARALGDALAVGLNDDASVRELKGAGRPINSAADRAEILAALTCVDFVAVFSGARATPFLEAVAPQIYVKGGDYSSTTLNPEEHAALKKVGTEIRFVPFVSGYSTSRVIEQLKSKT